MEIGRGARVEEERRSSHRYQMRISIRIGVMELNTHVFEAIVNGVLQRRMRSSSAAIHLYSYFMAHTLHNILVAVTV